MRNAQPALCTSLKDQQFPGNNKEINKHQQQLCQQSVMNVKPCEKLQMHQKSNNNQPQQKWQLLQQTPPPPLKHNSDNSDNSKNHHPITTTGRRIRRPPLWLGNSDKAQTVAASKAASNECWNAKAKHSASNNNTRNVNDDNDAENAKNDVAQRRFVCKSGLLARTKSFIIEFLQDSSIHGFVYLAKLGLNFIER